MRNSYTFIGRQNVAEDADFTLQKSESLLTIIIGYVCLSHSKKMPKQRMNDEYITCPCCHKKKRVKRKGWPKG